MATRSHIRFIQGSTQYQLMKFHDGDPEYMIPSLKQFLDYAKNRPNDINDLVPSYIAWGKLEEMENIKIKDFIKLWHKPLLLEIFMTDVTDDLPSDIQFFYVVDLDNKIIIEKHTGQNWSFGASDVQIVEAKS